MPQSLNIFVDLRLLFDIRIGHRHIRLWLIEIVVRDEILDCGIGKKFPVFGCELRRERFVVGYHERRLLHVQYDICNRKSLAAPCDAKERLVASSRS